MVRKLLLTALVLASAWAVLFGALGVAAITRGQTDWQSLTLGALWVFGPLVVAVWLRWLLAKPS